MKMGPVYSVCIAAWIILMHLVTVQEAYSLKIGDVTPAKPYIFINETLILNCTLHNSGTSVYSSSRLLFELSNVTVKDYVTAIDAKTIELRKPAVALEDAGWYHCFLHVESDEDKYVGSQEVQVEYAPHSVTNMSCVVFNWDDGMRCGWDLGNYDNLENVRVDVLYYIYGNQALFQCPDVGKTYCNWLADDFRGRYAYAINVTVTNLRRHLSHTSPLYMFKTADVVQPASVIDLREVEKNSSCIKISWSHSKIKTRPLVFRVKMKPAAGQIWKKVFEELPKTKNDLTVCHLLPYTSYTLAVDCKPEKNGLWSNETTVEITTAEDVPGSGPRVSAGGFLRHSGCEEQAFQNVTLFWQDNFQKNGIITGYRIEFDDRLEYVTGDVTKHTVSMLLCNTSHLLKIFAQTSVGFSKNYSQMWIPEVEKVPPMPKKFRIVLDETVKDTVQAVWERTSNLVTAFTVYWCQGAGIPCKNPIGWKTVGNVTDTRLPIDQSAAGIHLFGISAQTGNISSGFVWDSCVVYKHNKPQMPPRGVKVGNGQHLTVTWAGDWCLKREKVFVQKYVVHYCKVSACTATLKLVAVDGAKTSVSLASLQVGVNTSVQVQAMAAAGAGPLSKPVFAMLQQQQQTSPFPLKWILIPASMLAVLALLTGSCLCRKEICTRINILYPKNVDKNEVSYSNGDVHRLQSEPNSPVHLLSAQSQPALDVSNITQITIVEIETEDLVKSSGHGSLPSSKRENGDITRHNPVAQEEVLCVDLETGNNFITDSKLPNDTLPSENPTHLKSFQPCINSLSDYVSLDQDHVEVAFLPVRQEKNNSIQNLGRTIVPQRLAKTDAPDTYVDISDDVMKGILSSRMAASVDVSNKNVQDITSSKPDVFVDSSCNLITNSSLPFVQANLQHTEYCEVPYSGSVPDKKNRKSIGIGPLSNKEGEGPEGVTEMPVQDGYSSPIDQDNSIALLSLEGRVSGEGCEKRDPDPHTVEEEVGSASQLVSDYVMAAEDPAVMVESKL